jgi:hypothetical protein
MHYWIRTLPLIDHKKARIFQAFLLKLLTKKT